MTLAGKKVGIAMRNTGNTSC